MNLPRSAMLYLSLVILGAPTAAAQDVFQQFTAFPFPNPGADEILPDFGGLSISKVGHVIFAYDEEMLPETPETTLEDVRHPAEVVSIAHPNAAITALIDQQLRSPQSFQLDRIQLRQSFPDEWVWSVTWYIVPKGKGYGASGPDHNGLRFTAVVPALDDVLRPKILLCDTYAVAPLPAVYSCSTLEIAIPAADVVLPGQDEVRNRAEQAVAKLRRSYMKSDGGSAGPPEMHVFSVTTVEVPIDVTAEGTVESVQIWAVNFQSEARRGDSDQDDSKPADVFTVWVTPDGRVSDLRWIYWAWSEQLPADR